MAVYGQSPQDEGYSEDPLTVGTVSPPPLPRPSWLSAMSVPERTEYVMRLIDQLPTSAVCEIVERLSPRLYINFFQYLPAEICLKILGFLDPLSLINTARASREWMLLALDRKLWEEVYMLEGFRVIRSEVQKFEEEINADRSRFGGPSDEEHASKRRATPQRILPNLQVDDDYEMVDADIEVPHATSIFGPLTTEPKNSRFHESKFDSDVHMASSKTPSLSSQWTKTTSFPNRHATKTLSSSSHRISASSGSTSSRSSGSLSDMSSLVVVDRSDGKKKLNWQYLYSQRRRLEANWEAEKYTNFQLPHPNHPEEAHEECIYTIQFSGQYLVSGSRDRTLRIWDLNTKRLVRPPLRAHNGSVLCLQFDADPEEDLLVSGSSDATVVLWRFSTGQILQRLRKAHRESVLNVRFDKRVLVTCSKDKTIKIFNRRPIYAGELDYPGTIKGVNPVPRYLQNYGYNPAPTAGLPLVPAYSMIGCLEGHGAAVNAVQIHGDEVVSASGDRTVKAWNWREQTCTRTFIGHTKGIACVQYDGRRIVSGSSDNEVKVFDRVSGLEVASLRTHTNLVRTVQAGFGDLPYSSEEDQEEAQRTDREYFRAIESGAISPQTQPQRGSSRNAGSRRPEDITAYGGKIPPGGGGGKFGRIVSGSYDETIIIWRRDKEGVWRAQHTLRQEEAARASSRAAKQANDNYANAQAAAGSSSQTTNPSEPQSSVTDKSAAETYYEQLIDMIVPQGPMALRQGLQAHPQMLTSSHLEDVIQSLPGGTRHVMSAIVAQALQTQQQMPGSVAGIPLPVPVQNLLSPTQLPPVPAPMSDANPQMSTAQGSTSQVPPPPTAPTPAIDPNSHTAAAPAPQQAVPPVAHVTPHHHLVANMARVFKLQFDARRIICCSQTSIIVGWDFANGDSQLIEASRFFAPVE
ncbi:WD40 repeat-like protein [Venustampulla echinocandica]|uniref:WD40 repeat-like protein n=1 Tax=Venustampulla echinocandica TaxID=2656787 RepID=A0A370TZ57_9HELO|nr:WD40 repeat-like protein [Venustampulla echinocandica]RDL40794.1 WD40 repeat-like protein [Venustampulla echinocandica]